MVRAIGVESEAPLNAAKRRMPTETHSSDPIDGR